MNFIFFAIFGIFSALYIKTRLYPIFVILTLLTWNICFAYINKHNFGSYEVLYGIGLLTLNASLCVLIPYFIVFFIKMSLKQKKGS